MNKCLFIGGPADGLAIEVHDSQHQIVVPNSIGERPGLIGVQRGETSYRREVISGQDGRLFMVFIESSMTDSDAFAQLLAVYEKLGVMQINKQPKGYSELSFEIHEAPQTWMGGLLAMAVRMTKRKKFFADDQAILDFVKKSLERETIL